MDGGSEQSEYIADYILFIKTKNESFMKQLFQKVFHRARTNMREH